MPRRKSCGPCARDKTRCDLQQPSCSRCVVKNEHCGYITNVHFKPTTLPSALIESQQRHVDVVDEHASSSQWVEVGTVEVSKSQNEDQPPDAVRDSINHHDSRKLPSGTQDTILPQVEDIDSKSHSESITDISAIQNRWFYPFLEGAPRELGDMRESVVLICRILRSWPRMMASQDQLPPIFHLNKLHTWSKHPFLEKCIAISVMWEDDAGRNQELISKTIQNEMKRLFEEVTASSHLKRAPTKTL